jgi:hypothetical protein
VSISCYKSAAQIIMACSVPVLDINSTGSPRSTGLCPSGMIPQCLNGPVWQRGLHLISDIPRNMRNHLMPLTNKLMLRKRFVIVTVLGR